MVGWLAATVWPKEPVTIELELSLYSCEGGKCCDYLSKTGEALARLWPRSPSFKRKRKRGGGRKSGQKGELDDLKEIVCDLRAAAIGPLALPSGLAEWAG